MELIRANVNIIVIISVLVGLVRSLACSIYKYGKMGCDIPGLLSGIIVTAIFLVIFYVAIDRFIHRKNNKLHLSFTRYIYMFFIILCSYIICFLVYFPGVGMNDGLNILREGMGIISQFPVFYVAYITVLRMIGYHFGGLQIAIALYTIIQVLILSVIITFILHWIINNNFPKALKVVSFLYFAFLPIICMYTISMIKDTVFSLLLVAMMIFLYEIVENNQLTHKRSFWLAFCFLIIGITCLRNNGKYILAPLLVIMFIAYKEFRKEIVRCLCVFVVCIVMTNIAMHIYHAEEQFQEVVGIPLQQVCAVVREDGDYKTSDKEEIERWMSVKDIQAYSDPYTVDPIKWNPDGKFNREYFNTHKKEFIKLWFSLLPSNLGLYTKAYLQSTYWFWAPVQSGKVQCLFTIENIANNTWLIEFLKENHIHDNPLLPAFISENLKRYYLLGEYFFREGILAWIMIISMIVSMKYYKKAFIIYAPCILLWLTIMISTPASFSLRYVFVFVYGLPIFILLPYLFIKKTYIESESSPTLNI